MSGKYKKRCRFLNYVEHLLILVIAITGCVLISTFSLLACVSVGITGSALGIKIVHLLQELKSINQL